jgi:hypothetical protein
MPLAAAAPALEFRAHCGAHHQLLLCRLGAHDGQVQQADEWRLAEAFLQCGHAERFVAHGTITSLPKTSRFSSRASAPPVFARAALDEARVPQFRKI